MDPVQLACLDPQSGSRSSRDPVVGIGGQRVLGYERKLADGALDHFFVDLDVSVVKEAAETC